MPYQHPDHEPKHKKSRKSHKHSSKLHLKETPAESALREEKKIRKRAKKAIERKYGDAAEIDQSNGDEEEYGYIFDFAAGPSASSSTQPSHNAKSKKREREDDDEEFASKLADAIEDDAHYAPASRLDAIENNMNDYAHVPRRWRSYGGHIAEERGSFRDDIYDDDRDAYGDGGRGASATLEPWMMDDEEYTMWIRESMARKKRASSPSHILKEEMKQRRREADARARKVREETARMEREEIVRREQRRSRKHAKRREEQRVGYEEAWDRLIKGKRKDSEENKDLRFEDVPWPIFSMESKGNKATFEVEDITPDRVEAFLLSQLSTLPSPPDIGPLPSYFVLNDTSHLNSNPDSSSTASPAQAVPTRKDILRAAMLRYHPDKFESRVLKFVKEDQVEQVREACGAVVRAVGELLQRGDQPVMK